MELTTIAESGAEREVHATQEGAEYPSCRLPDHFFDRARWLETRERDA
jgi:hypothetical protein